MTMRDEIRIITEAFEAENKTITAEAVVEAAKDEKTFPLLNAHLWQVPEADLAQEARVTRAHRLLISVRIVTEEGTSTRLLMHTPGLAGYRASTHVIATPDLASIKLRQLTDDVARARGRLRDFRMMLPGEVSDEIDSTLEEAERKITDAIAKRNEEAGVAA